MLSSAKLSFKIGRGFVRSGLLVCSLLFMGCAGEPDTAPPPAQPPAESGRAASNLTHPVSINEVMVALVDHAAHEIWDVQTSPPQTDEEWAEIEHHALQLIAGGTAIQIPGTGIGDELWVQGGEWVRYSQEMTDIGVAALTGIRSRDEQAILNAGDQLVETCEGCHDVYKPEIPSEGYLHPHYYE